MNPSQQSPVTMSPISNYQDLQAMGTAPQPSAAPLAQQQTAQPKQNWFERLLPTLGSVAGWGLGAALAPETGGASLLLGALGSSLGQGAGRVAENAATGQSATSGLGGELVGGALGGLAGGAVGGALEHIGGGLASMGAKGAEDRLTSSAADVYKAVPKSLRQAYDSKGQVNFLKTLGVDPSMPSNMTLVANNANDVLNSTLGRVLDENGPVDMSGYNDIVKNALADQSHNLGAFDKVAVGRGRLGYANTPAAKLLQSLEQQGMGIAKQNADPNEVRTLLQRVQAAAADAKPSVSTVTGAIDPVQKSTYKALNDIAGQLKQALYDRPEIKASVKALKGDIGAEDVGGSQALADHINNVLNTSSSAQNLLDELSRFTNMGKLGAAGSKAEKDIVQALKAAGISGNSISPGAAVQIGKHVASGEHLAGATKLMQAFKDAGLGDQAAARAGNVLTRIAKITGGGVAGAASLPEMEGPGGQQTMQPTQLDQTQQPNQLDYMLQAAMLDPNQFQGVLSTLAPTIQKAQAEQALLQSLPGLYQQAGGAQGFGGGLLSNIQALIPGTAAYNYEQAKKAAAAQGAPFGLTPGVLPNFMTTPQGAGQQFGAAQNVLSAMPV